MGPGAAVCGFHFSSSCPKRPHQLLRSEAPPTPTKPDAVTSLFSALRASQCTTPLSAPPQTTAPSPCPLRLGLWSSLTSEPFHLLFPPLSTLFAGFGFHLKCCFFQEAFPDLSDWGNLYFLC